MAPGAKRGAHEAGGRALWGGGRPTPSWAPRMPYSVVLKSPVRDFLQKYLFRRFHSVWTPFDIPFLQNPEIGKKNSNLDWAFGLVG